MFTFKKIAMIGVAGLATFAMSCSDDNDDPAAVSVTPLVLEQNADKSWKITGGGAVEAGAGLKSVKIDLVGEDGAAIANSAMLPMNLPSTLIEDTTSINVFDLMGNASATGISYSYLVINDCPEGETVEAYIEITAVDVNDATGSAKSNKITFECGTSGNPGLTGQFDEGIDVEVGGTSATLGSFVDLDPATPAIYLTSGLTSAAIKNAIDIVYASNGTKLVPAMGTVAGTTSLASIYAISQAEYDGVLASAAPVTAAAALNDMKIEADAAEGGNVTVGGYFVGLTSEEAPFIIEVKTGTTAEKGIFLVMRKAAED